MPPSIVPFFASSIYVLSPGGPEDLPSTEGLKIRRDGPKETAHPLGEDRSLILYGPETGPEIP